MTTARGRVLTVAGSDSGAGAGIQADLKTVMALGGFATTAITAVTAQDTRGVAAILPVPADFVQQQMELVLADIGADCVKTGMLLEARIVAAVADVLAERAPSVPLVLDPVLVSTSGRVLLDPGAIDLLKHRLIARATVLTPNLPEAATLTGHEVGDLDDMKRAAEALLRLGARNVLLKGGHLAGAKVSDLLLGEAGEEVLESPRLDTRHTHGTGCTLAAAVATGLAQGMAVPAAVRRARAYVLEAIRTAPRLGSGNGPLNHAVAAAIDENA